MAIVPRTMEWSGISTVRPDPRRFITIKFNAHMASPNNPPPILAELHFLYVGMDRLNPRREHVLRHMAAHDVDAISNIVDRENIPGFDRSILFGQNRSYACQQYPALESGGPALTPLKVPNFCAPETGITAQRVQNPPPQQSNTDHPSNQDIGPDSKVSQPVAEPTLHWDCNLPSNITVSAHSDLRTLPAHSQRPQQLQMHSLPIPFAQSPAFTFGCPHGIQYPPAANLSALLCQLPRASSSGSGNLQDSIRFHDSSSSVLGRGSKFHVARRLEVIQQPPRRSVQRRRWSAPNHARPCGNKYCTTGEMLVNTRKAYCKRCHSGYMREWRLAKKQNRDIDPGWKTDRDNWGRSDSAVKQLAGGRATNTLPRGGVFVAWKAPSTPPDQVATLAANVFPASGQAICKSPQNEMQGELLAAQVLNAPLVSDISQPFQQLAYTGTRRPLTFDVAYQRLPLHLHHLLQIAQQKLLSNPAHYMNRVNFPALFKGIHKIMSEARRELRNECWVERQPRNIGAASSLDVKEFESFCSRNLPVFGYYAKTIGLLVAWFIGKWIDDDDDHQGSMRGENILRDLMHVLGEQGLLDRLLEQQKNEEGGQLDEQERDNDEDQDDQERLDAE